LIFMNNVRTLGSHRWTGPGSELTFEQQLLDSCDYPHPPWITELWGPTGTRYHATHHLFPSLPYDDLGKAHRRLVAGLPIDSLFHETVRISLIEEIQALWRRSSLVRRSHHKWLRLPQTHAALTINADFEPFAPSKESENDACCRTSTASSNRAA
ncbi:MAG: hypothetical protein FJ308_18400, partial [Planctomycetes bacterium]|nr:hypothetical protein [Planctomycetota bacterium]